MAQRFPFKSETKPWTPGQNMEFFDFVPARGPKGGRVVIDKFIIRVSGSITVATALWDGRDVPKLFQNLQIETRSGRLRWSGSGCKSRLASVVLHGADRHLEHANIAVGVGAIVDLSLIVPLEKRFAVRPRDFSMPADMFKKLALSTSSLAAAATGTTVLSAATLNVYVLAIWHEEFNVEFKCEDSVICTDFTSTTQAKLSLSGPVHDLFIVKESTTAGGDLITGITDARIEDLGTPLLTRGDYVADYTQKRGLGNTNAGATPGGERIMDPVREGKLLPVIVSDEHTSFFDGRIVESLKLDVGGGVAGLSCITRQVLPKDQQGFDATCARYNVDPRRLRVKTAGKSNRELHHWDRQELVMAPMSAELPK